MQFSTFNMLTHCTCPQHAPHTPSPKLNLRGLTRKANKGQRIDVKKIHGGATTELLSSRLVLLPQPLPLQLLFHYGSSSFKGLVIPHARRRDTAQADAPINVHQSPEGRQPLWAETLHQSLARSQFWAFYHPLELP